MSSGESDAYALAKTLTQSNDYDYSVTVRENTWSDIPTKTIVNGNYTVGTTSNWSDYNYFTTWPSVVYYYQIRCPKKGCKVYNWVELDKVKPCYKCGSRLKAVSEQVDFEVPVVR